LKKIKEQSVYQNLRYNDIYVAEQYEQPNIPNSDDRPNVTDQI
jgi:hypothetical protein